MDPDDMDNEIAFESLADLGKVVHQQAELIKQERAENKKGLVSCAHT